MDTTAKPQSNASVRTMKAAIRTEYGPPGVLHMAEVPRPTPKDTEVLVKIFVTTVTSADCRLRSLNVPAGFGLIVRLAMGMWRPRQTVLGSEFAGEVEAIGSKVTGFKVGDRVFGMSGASMGAYAQYKCAAEDGPLAHIPPNLSYEEAAALPFGGTTALDFFRRGGLKAGDRLLVNGASGAVGVAAVQLARDLGADVTAVCSGRNAELVLELGACRVVDYTRQDFTRLGQTYDVILDTVGTAPFVRSKPVLRKGGRLLLVLATLAQMLAAPWESLVGGRKIVAGPGSERAEDVRLLAKLAQEGRLRPVIDRRYSLEQIAEAHSYVETGRKRGSVVLTVQHEPHATRS
ncbi:NAD(P)-dependent alcohol dehydrogenase [Meiothermus sp.]|uniref:NAD(P)-dependent alcohol dehydrogenase n=1 Tax=Meiothermus sp. TaxID=1955249 RepID=UPI0021DCD81C|nr:NAD(P)-dependent alcohol dehydrogenase [Meiothermus sp.]GIW34956.1 MAG: alcohol dehydrogenase [Meiothermus sp.]